MRAQSPSAKSSGWRIILLGVINIMSLRGCYWSFNSILIKLRFFLIQERWIFMCGHLVCSSLAEVSLHHYRLFVKFTLLIEMISYQVQLQMRTTPCAYKEKIARTWIMRLLTPNTTTLLVFSLTCPFEHHSLFRLHNTFASSVVLPHFLLQMFDKDQLESHKHCKLI